MTDRHEARLFPTVTLLLVCLVRPAWAWQNPATLGDCRLFERLFVKVAENVRTDSNAAGNQPEGEEGSLLPGRLGPTAIFIRVHRLVRFRYQIVDRFQCFRCRIVVGEAQTEG